MKWILFSLVALFLLSGCFAEPAEVDLNQVVNYPSFWMGLWQGLIAPVSFVISLFNDGVAIYQSGGSGWYDLGFLLGISSSLGGSSQGAKRARRRR
ncbi:MAG: hypothetical protein JXQ87_00995 [Bacteroidia bacterium]